MTLEDKELAVLIKREYQRQCSVIQLIASENLPTTGVAEVLGYWLLNYKTAEGLPGKRYHSGCAIVDDIENLAIARAKDLFRAKYVNVQPITATLSNQAVFRALVEEHDKVLSFDTRCGGHFSHSSYFKNIHHYSVDPQTFQLDYEEIRKVALKVKPKLIIAGASAYPRKINFREFRRIADEVGAFLMADIAHIAGLVASGDHDSPIDNAHATTASTYKTLRGPRSGVILSGKDFDMSVKGRKLFDVVNRSLFPGLQSSPNISIIAAKAVCFYESLQEEFGEYIQQVLRNSKALAGSLLARGQTVLTGGTDNHIVLISLAERKITGVVAEQALEEVGILTNRNLIPFDSNNAMVTSGLRLGTPFLTSRGFQEAEMILLGECIDEVIQGIKPFNHTEYTLDNTIRKKVKGISTELALKHPLF